ncbi:cysteine desulfurase family protein [Pseudoclavibacter sp. CFCC 11306]|uniref:cysteine desulfurase family protein n=1 Tax=Pseudoclavibacter sp. CFCC 11306 TaxID=1564493 RepID=UPI001CE43161|nr:cysteine desulfurase family protein [Pseudoclavibacter sp. CFCC 11306]
MTDSHASYLDNAATAPMLPAALDAYVHAAQVVGNASAVHTAGQHSRALVEQGRARVAASLGADPAEIVFTAGGTESINQAVKGIYWWREADGRRPLVVIAEAEHHATEASARWLEQTQGAQVRRIPVDREARIDLTVLRELVDAEGARVALISVIAANNEVGTLQPLGEIAEIARAHDISVHVDAVAAYGQVPLDFHELGIAAMSVSAHKIGGPLGTGALVLRRDVTPVPLLHGGGQERRLRSGTLDTPSIAAFGVAAEHVVGRLSAHASRLAELRDRLILGIRRAVPEAIVTGARGDQRLPGNVHAVFPGCEGDSLLFLLDAAGVRASTGSACTAGIPQPSHVLEAMGFDEQDSRSALRFTLGEDTGEGDVDAVLEVLPEVYRRARQAGMSANAPTIY